MIGSIVTSELPFAGDTSVFRTRAQATPRAVRAVLQEFDAKLPQLRCPAEMTARVRIALAEVLNNIAEHACADLPEARFLLEIGTRDDGLSVVVRDPGRAFPGNVLPRGRPPVIDLPAQDLPEGGFGWFLIRAVTDGLDHARIDGWTHLRLWFAPRADADMP